MEIWNCPECAADTVRVGIAMWCESDDLVAVYECAEPECSWAGVEGEQWRETAPAVALTAA
jgi:hypothetical protein